MGSAKMAHVAYIREIWTLEQDGSKGQIGSPYLLMLGHG